MHPPPATLVGPLAIRFVGLDQYHARQLVREFGGCMGDVGRRAVLKEEQAAIDHAYGCVERNRAVNESLATPKRWIQDDPESGTAFIHDVPPELLGAYADVGSDALVVMRVNVEEAEGEPETFYIGRRTVKDWTDDRRIVIGWSSPAAIRWQLALPGMPGAIRLRRHLHCEGHLITSYSDDIVVRPQAEPGLSQSPVSVDDGSVAGLEDASIESRGQTIEDFLLQDLDRARDGRMRDIIESIKRDQLILVADQRKGLLVVQGGPGTGKTAVGLHRVAWLLNPENKRFTAGEILVLGPHREFLDYVGTVLPRLGNRNVRTVTLNELWDTAATETDTVLARRVKSDERMAQVLRRAVHNTVRLDPLNSRKNSSLELEHHGAVLRIPQEDIESIVRQALDGAGPFEGRRNRAIDQLLDRLVTVYADARPREARGGEIRSLLKKNSQFVSLLNAVWPARPARHILRQMLSSRKVLSAAASEILTEEEQEALIVPPNRLWAQDDLVCLDELEYLLTGDVAKKYRHLVIDEAQDLTPMQARALARRCPSGSMTILGDLAQATGPHAYDSWDRIARLLTGKDGWSLAELTVGYRVPREVMDFAAPLAAVISPGTVFPASVRPLSGNAVTMLPANPWRLLDDAVAQAISLTGTDGEQSRSIALIVPDDAEWIGEVQRRLEIAKEGASEHAQAIRILPAALTKGLEFDHVIVLEPASIAERGHAGLNQLYVALTRCTQTLTIVHTSPLPNELTPAPEDPNLGQIEGPGRRCSRFHANGEPCKHRTFESDGWCRQEDCGGFRRAEPLNTSPRFRHVRYLLDADLEAKLPLSAAEAGRVGVSRAARTQFIDQHGGGEHTAEVEIRQVLGEFLETAQHVRQRGGYWLLDRDGYRLVLAPDAKTVTAYRTGHLDRTYAQFAAAVPSRVGRKIKAAQRSAMGTKPEPSTPLEEPAKLRQTDIATLFITERACEAFDRLIEDSRDLLNDDFDTMVRRHFSVDLNRGHLIPQEHYILLIGEKLTWAVSLDGRVIKFLRAHTEHDLELVSLLKSGDGRVPEDWSALSLVGAWITGRVVSEAGTRCFYLETDRSFPCPVVLNLRRYDPAPAIGDSLKGWVYQERNGKLFVSINQFGRLPISETMRRRYAAALTIFTQLSEGGVAGAADQLSELKGMANRCLRKDQGDWLSVWEVLGRPEEQPLRDLANLAQRARAAHLATDDPAMRKTLTALNASGWAAQLPAALRRLLAHR